MEGLRQRELCDHLMLNYREMAVIAKQLVSRGALISTSESSDLDSSRIPVPLGLGSINRLSIPHQTVISYDVGLLANLLTLGNRTIKEIPATP
jgi:hypothetical protein